MTKLVMVRSFEVRKTRNRDNYAAMRLNLGEAGDFVEIEARAWGWDELAPAGALPPVAGDVLEVTNYKVEQYQGRAQWVVRGFRLLTADQRQAVIKQFQPPTRIDEAAYRARLESLIAAVDPQRACGRVLCEIFDRADFRARFYRAPAASVHHQNYPGGLLEHTINVTTLALALADAYLPAPAGTGLTFNGAALAIDRPLLIAAGLLHDIGKIDTYQFNPLPDVTEANSWEGHLAIGYAEVRAQCAPLFAAPPYPGAGDELNKLLHCILAHHGTLEYGSPVAPACVEAFLLAQADMTDARMGDVAKAAEESRQRTPDQRWLARQLHFPGGFFIGGWAGADPRGAAPGGGEIAEDSQR